MAEPTTQTGPGRGAALIGTGSLASITQALERINACGTVAQLGSFLFEAAAFLGLQATAGGMLTGPKAGSGDLFYFNNWPESWAAVYRSSGIMERDPVVRWAMVSGAPITWTDLQSRLAPDDPSGDLFALAAQHRYTEGFALPVRSQAGHLGLFSVAGERGPLSLGEQGLLQLLGTAGMNRAEMLAGHSDAARPARLLTEREQECVALLAKGLDGRAIAARLGISATTARFHLDNARMKLRATSRAELAELAAGFTQNRR